MRRLIIVTTQKWEYTRWMHGQVRSVVQHRVLARCPSPLLRGDWWCWMCPHHSSFLGCRVRTLMCRAEAHSSSGISRIQAEKLLSQAL